LFTTSQLDEVHTWADLPVGGAPALPLPEDAAPSQPENSLCDTPTVDICDCQPDLSLCRALECPAKRCSEAHRIRRNVQPHRLPCRGVHVRDIVEVVQVIDPHDGAPCVLTVQARLYADPASKLPRIIDDLEQLVEVAATRADAARRVHIESLSVV